MLDKESVSAIFDYALDMGSKLLKEQIPSLTDDQKYRLAVAMTTLVHEGVRLGIEFNRLGGQPPEGPTQ